MEKKSLFILAIIGGLTVLYGIISALVFITRGKWSRLNRRKLTLGGLILAFNLMISGAAYSQQSTSTPYPTAEYTPVPTLAPTNTPSPTPLYGILPTIIPEPTPSPSPPLPLYGIMPRPGDVDNSGVVDIVDALKVARHVIGLTPVEFYESAADVDNSGTIDIVDALCIAQKSIGLIDEFPDNS